MLTTVQSSDHGGIWEMRLGKRSALGIGFFRLDTFGVLPTVLLQIYTAYPTTWLESRRYLTLQSGIASEEVQIASNIGEIQRHLTAEGCCSREGGKKELA